MKLKIATVIDVAERQLCCGCGACAYAAPEAIEMKDVIDHGVRPIVKTGHFRDESLKTALAVCPGVALQHDHDPAEGRDGALAELADGWGPVLEVWEGWIDDDEARFRGSSGGGVTALARHGIEDGGMAGVVHIAARPDVPYLNETVFSTNRKELARGSGSRYAPASPCDGLGMIEDADGPCVFVGKPCDVAAANKAAARNPALARNLGLTIGIFCAGTPSTEGTLKMMERLGVAEPDDLAELRYRGHGWPGEATSITHDGTENRLTYQQSWGEVLSAHAQWRCRICPDHTGEFADIAVGDPWYRDIEPGEPGRSLFIVRTQRGRDFLMAAKAAGHLVIEKVDPATLPASQPNLLKVRGNVWMRVWIMRLLGAAVPTYTNIPTRPFWFSQLSWREKLQSILGTAKRVFRRGLRERTPMRPTPATNPPRRASVQEERNEPPRVGKAGRMIGVTAGVALVGIVLVLFLRPGRAVGVLVAAMLLYPDFLRIPMGLAQMSASRLIALALLARMLCRAERIEYKWILADTIVIVIYLWTLLAAFITDAGHEQVVWSIGNGLDTALIYFVARFTLSRLEHRRDAVLPFCLILLWLGAIGFLESVTGWSPYQRLLQYNAWQWMDKGLEYRMGFVRARGASSHPIYFGVSMFAVTVMTASFSSLSQRSWFHLAAIFAGVVGACSSLSSGPQLSITICLVVCLFYFRTEYIKPALLAIFVLGVFAEVLSDRRFYYLIDYLNFSGGTSYYRNRLMEVAVTYLPEYWTFGYGSEHPHHWGAQVDGRIIVDIVNHYIFLAVKGGIVPAIGYLVVQCLGLRESWVTWKLAGKRVRRMAFIQSGGLLGVMMGSLAVSLFAPAVGLVYMLMAVMVRQPLNDPLAYDVE